MYISKTCHSSHFLCQLFRRRKASWPRTEAICCVCHLADRTVSFCTFNLHGSKSMSVAFICVEAHTQRHIYVFSILQITVILPHRLAVSTCMFIFSSFHTQYSLRWRIWTAKHMYFWSITETNTQNGTDWCFLNTLNRLWTQQCGNVPPLFSSSRCLCLAL